MRNTDILNNIKKNNTQPIFDLISKPDSHIYTNFNFILVCAAQYGCIPLINVLIKDDRLNVSNYKDSAFLSACKYGQTEAVKILLDFPPIQPSAQQNEAFCIACKNGHAEVVKLLLLDKRINPNDQFHLPLRIVSDLGHTNILKLLLDKKGIDPSSKNNYALIHSSINGYIENVKLLLKNNKVLKGDLKYLAITGAHRHQQYEIFNILWKNQYVREELRLKDFESYKLFSKIKTQQNIDNF